EGVMSPFRASGAATIGSSGRRGAVPQRSWHVRRVLRGRPGGWVHGGGSGRGAGIRVAVRVARAANPSRRNRGDRARRRLRPGTWITVDWKHFVGWVEERSDEAHRLSRWASLEGSLDPPLDHPPLLGGPWGRRRRCQRRSTSNDAGSVVYDPGPPLR